jgi:hypothetical protein
VSTQVISLTSDVLRAWSNDPDAAKSNLRSILAALKADESISEWANEALENCGEPLDSDLDFLAQAARDQDSSTAFWACTLLGRSGARANALQGSLIAVLESKTAQLALRQQAALALASIGPLTAASREALQSTRCSEDARLARLSTQALGPDA